MKAEPTGTFFLTTSNCGMTGCDKEPHFKNDDAAGEEHRAKAHSYRSNFLVTAKPNMLSALFLLTVASLLFSAVAIWYLAIEAVFFILFVKDAKIIRLVSGSVLNAVVLLTVLTGTTLSLKVSVDDNTIVWILNYLVFCQLAYIGFSMLKHYGKQYILHGLWQCSFVLIFAAILGIYELVFHDNPFKNFSNFLSYQEYAIGTSMLRSTGIFGNPTPFANLIILGLIIAEILYKNRLVKLAISAIYLIALFGTQSRSGWVAFAAVAFVYLFMKIRKGKGEKAFLALAISLLLGLIIALIFYDTLQIFITKVASRFSIYAGSGSQAFRNESFSIVISQILVNSDIFSLVFGHGYGYANYVLGTMRSIATVDYGWLSLLVDMGLLTLFLLLFIIGYSVIKLLKPDANKMQKCIGLFLVGTSVMLISYEAYGWNVVAVFLLPFIGMSMQGYKNSSGNKIRKKELL